METSLISGGQNVGRLQRLTTLRPGGPEGGSEVKRKGAEEAFH
jgi:hypothetical protein